MRVRLTGRDRRALLLGGAVLGPALLYALAAGPYLSALDDTRGQLEAERGLLERELRLVALADSLPPRAARARQESERAQRLLFGELDDVSPVALERYLADQAAASRVFVEQSEVRVGEAAAGGLVALEVDLRAVSDFQGIMEWLYLLENGPRLVHVERLNVGRAGTEATETEERLSVSLTARGFALPPTSPPDATGGEGGR